MYQVNDDMSIYATRGDIVLIAVTADDDGELYTFQAGDVLRIKIFGKKDAENVILQKDFPVENETQKVELVLTEEDTKIGEVISKPKDYWYEIELNPYTNPQTIIGYDEDGPKVFKLFPEGKDIPEVVIDPEDIPIVDEELSLVSTRPVQNQAIARAVVSLTAELSDTNKELAAHKEATAEANREAEEAIATERGRIDQIVALKEGSTTGDAELADIRVDYEGTVHESAGTSVREQINTCLQNMRYLKDNKFNLFTKSDCEVGYFYNYLGEKTAFSTVYSTKLIDITGCESLTFNVDATNYGAHALTFWDENEAFLSYVSVSTDTYTVSSFPDGAKYIRLAVYSGEATPKIFVPFSFAEAEELAARVSAVEQNMAVVAKKYSSFSILGDSYSTFSGFTDPAENAQYYPILSDTVTSVNDTWWHKFATETGLPLVANNSYSGSRIATGKGDGQSFVDRANNIGKPSLIVIFGATNDISSEIGEYQYSGWTADDLKYFRPALAYLLNYFAEHNPGAKCVFVLNNGLGATLTESVQAICGYYGVSLLELADIDKVNGHPTETGMTQIKDQLVRFLNLE